MRTSFLLILLCSLTVAYGMELSAQEMGDSVQETDPLILKKGRRVKAYKEMLKRFLYHGWGKRKLMRCIAQPSQLSMTLQELEGVLVYDNGYGNGEAHSNCCAYLKSRNFKRGYKGVLHCAFRRGDRSLVHYLLSKGCNPNTPFWGRNTWETQNVVVGYPLALALDKKWFDVAVDLINRGAHVKDEAFKEAFPSLQPYAFLILLGRFKGRKLDELISLFFSKGFRPSGGAHIPSLKTDIEQKDCHEYQNIVVYAVRKRADLQPFFEHGENLLSERWNGNQTPLHFFAIGSDGKERRANKKDISYLLEQIRIFNRRLREDGGDYESRRIDIEQLKAAKDQFGRTAYEYFQWDVIQPKLELIASAPVQDPAKANTTIQ